MLTTTIRVLAVGLLATGCLSKAEAVSVRFFELPPAAAREAQAGDLISINIGRAASVTTIDEQLMWRLSPVEVTYDETARWVAPPAQLVHDAIQVRLFDVESFASTTTGRSTSGSIVLEQFEGDLERGLARVAFRFRGAGPGGEDSLQRRFEATAPLKSRSSEALAHGLGAALDEALDELVVYLRE